MHAPSLRLVRAGASALAGLLVAAFSGCVPTNQYQAPEPPKVTVARPLVQTVYDYLQETGSTEAVEMVKIRARVRGFIERVNFEPGQYVRGETEIYEDAELTELEDVLPPDNSAAPPSSSIQPSETSPEGASDKEESQADILYVIEKQVYEAEVNKATAALAVAKADFLNADVRLRRAIPLAEKNVITKEELDERRAEYAVGEAKVKAAVAQLNEKKINLNYCDVRSPITGRIGKTLVKVGNLVDGNEGTHLVTVIQYDPIYVNFSISETTWQRITDRLKKEGEELTRDQYAEIKMFASRQVDGDDYPFEGHLNYINLEVEESTGTFPVRGIFKNPDKLLYPGMFVKVRVVPREPIENALLVPERCIGTDQQGRYVLVVNGQDVVERRTVDVENAPRFKEMQVVHQGLSEDDRVIVDGLQWARIGAKVNPQLKPLDPLESDGAQMLTRSTDRDRKPLAPPPPEKLDESAKAIFEQQDKPPTAAD